MIGVLLACVALAAAAPLAPEEALTLARRFYALTGRLDPAAGLLEDDVAALLESGRGAEELDRAVRWIAAEVPAADRYTLAALLESHLAAALGEDEELILPEDLPDAAATLAPPTPPPPRFEPPVALTRELLAAYYADTGRAAPEPPLEEDLTAFALLSREGWTEAGLRRLVEWVPANVAGVEGLSFGQVARVAVEQGYNGGPRPDGELETLRGVTRAADPAAAPRARDPLAFDGGRLQGFTTLGALPAPADLAMQAARIPGQDLREVELAGRVDGGGGGFGGLLVARTEGWGGFVAQLDGLSHPPGALPSDRVGPDGGLTRPLAYTPGPVASGRLSLARAGPRPAGLTAWIHEGDPGAGAGIAGSIAWSEALLVELGAGAVARPVDGMEVSGTTLSAALSPSLTLGDATLRLHARGQVVSGGLADDAFPIEADLWTERRGQLQANLLGGAGAWRWGLALGAQGATWRLTWIEDDRSQRLEQERAGVELAAELAMGAAWAPGPRLRLHGGVRGSAGAGQGAAGELALGATALLGDLAWLGLGARAGQVPSLQASLTLPF